jgi:hypothetical protein
VLDGVSSPITKRVCNLGLDEVLRVVWSGALAGIYQGHGVRVALKARGQGTVSINVRITAVRKLAVEARR